MKRMGFIFEAELRLETPAQQHVFTLRCLPDDGDTQHILKTEFSVQPSTALLFQRDGFGNGILCGSLRAPHTRFFYHADGAAQVDFKRRKPVSPEQALPFRGEGEQTKPDAALMAYYQTLAPALEKAGAREQAELLCREVSRGLSYLPGVTRAATTAAEAFRLGRGVCQDFTHVFLVLARQAGLTARYCMGLAPGARATHAWAEVLLPEGWVGFDPTCGSLTSEGYLRFAVGRDASDCPAERGVFHGGGRQTQAVHMELTEM